MIKKKIIGVFLILLFSFQLVPVLQVGSFLYQGQMTEELPHSDTGTGGKMLSGDCKQLLSGHEYDGLEEAILSIDHSFSLLAEAFNTRHADDIQTPPPNHFS